MGRIDRNARDPFTSDQDVRGRVCTSIDRAPQQLRPCGHIERSRTGGDSPGPACLRKDIDRLDRPTARERTTPHHEAIGGLRSPVDTVAIYGHTGGSRLSSRDYSALIAAAEDGTTHDRVVLLVRPIKVVRISRNTRRLCLYPGHDNGTHRWRDRWRHHGCSVLGSGFRRRRVARTDARGDGPTVRSANLCALSATKAPAGQLTARYALRGTHGPSNVSEPSILDRACGGCRRGRTTRVQHPRQQNESDNIERTHVPICPFRFFPHSLLSPTSTAAAWRRA